MTNEQLGKIQFTTKDGLHYAVNPKTKKVVATRINDDGIGIVFQRPEMENEDELPPTALVRKNNGSIFTTINLSDGAAYSLACLLLNDLKNKGYDLKI